MKKGMTHMVTLALFFFVSSAFALTNVDPQQGISAVHSGPLTLNELIRIALEQNPQLASVRQGIEIAGYGISAAKGQRFGRLDLFSQDVTYGPLNNSLLMKNLVVDQRVFVDSGAAEFNRNLFGFGATLTIPIYTGGRITNEIGVEELRRRIATDRLSQTRDGLIFNVSSAYYTILKLQAFIEAIEKSVEYLEESKRVVDARRRAGKAAPTEVLKISTRLAAVRQSLIRATNMHQMTLGVLHTLIGLGATQHRIHVVESLRYEPRELDLSTSVDNALRRRPDLLAKQKELEVQEKKVRIAFSSHLPNISLNGRAEALTGDQSSLFDQEFAGITMTLPLFAGGVIQSRVSQERAKLVQLRQEMATLKLDVTLDVQTAYLSATEAEQRIMAAVAAVEEAQEVLRVEALKMKVGKGIIENLLDAQAALLQAEQNHDGAVGDYNIALVGLQRAVGVIDLEKAMD